MSTIGRTPSFLLPLELLGAADSDEPVDVVRKGALVVDESLVTAHTLAEASWKM